MPLWNELEGQTIEGLPLARLLRSEGRTAWFSTTDPGGQPAVLGVFESLNDEDAIEARLQTAARLTHTNLQTIRGTGRGRVEDESLVYVVLEPYDQTLSDVLRDRTLDTTEAREVTESLLGALEAVEAAGLRHGHVDASGVLAIGDSIKLRSDCLAPRRPEGDAPALAALIYNALTGRRLTSETDALQLPAPFATLVRAGLGSSGSLAAMRRVLQGPSVAAAAPVAPTPVTPPEKAVVASTPAPAPASASASATKPPAKVEARPKPTPGAAIPRAELQAQRERAATSNPLRRRPVLIAAVVLMALALVAFYAATKHQPSSTTVVGEAPAPQATAAADPVQATASNAQSTMGAGTPPVETPAPPARKPVPVTASPSTVAEAVPTNGRSAWHVVVYTYTHQSAAERKATELAQRYPQLEPQVFSPSGHAPYLVVLGGAMDRQAAFARRDQARAAGLPPDTYAQNYSH